MRLCFWAHWVVKSVAFRDGASTFTAVMPNVLRKERSLSCPSWAGRGSTAWRSGSWGTSSLGSALDWWPSFKVHSNPCSVPLYKWLCVHIAQIVRVHHWRECTSLTTPQKYWKRVSLDSGVKVELLGMPWSMCCLKSIHALFWKQR